MEEAWASPGGSDGNEPVCKAGGLGSIPGSGRSQKGMATHSSIFAWRIPWTEEPGGYSPWGSQRVGHDGTTNTHTHRGSLEREEKRSITSPSIRDLIFSILLKYLPHLSHIMRGTVKSSFVLLRPVCCCGCNLP